MTLPPNVILVSAQPDQTYFHWQVEIYLYQFAKHGIQDQCYALFGYRGLAPSPAGLALAKKYKNIIFYKDSRSTTIPNYYIPSIRPHLFQQFFSDHPELGANVFIHDSDIFLVSLPPFEKMLGTDIAHLSDTIGYIGHKYIKDCADRYKAKYPALQVDDIFTKMCATVGISEELVKANQANSGGAQYLFKNIDAAFWAEVETVTNSLYVMLKEYEKAWPIDHHIQSWTAGMWADLWVYWKRGGRTIVDPALSFSWATSPLHEYHTNNIFHLAGVTAALASTMFYKGDYIHKNVLLEYGRNKSLFDHVSPKNATFEYVKVIKEYVDVMPPPITVNPEAEVTRFLLKAEGSAAWSDIYTKDESIWRSTSGTYIIFRNRAGWTLTHSQYESTLTDSTGGYASTNSEQPYEEGGWNHACSVRLM